MPMELLYAASALAGAVLLGRILAAGVARSRARARVRGCRR